MNLLKEGVLIAQNYHSRGSLPTLGLKRQMQLWQPTPVILPGESQGRGSLVGCRLWGRPESEWLKRLSSSSSSACNYMKVARLPSLSQLDVANLQYLAKRKNKYCTVSLMCRFSKTKKSNLENEEVIARGRERRK